MLAEPPARPATCGPLGENTRSRQRPEPAGADPGPGGRLSAQASGGLHDGAVPPPSGRRAGEPGASRDAAGMRRERVGATPSPAASGNATARLGPGALSPRHGWDPRAASCKAGARRRRWPGLPRPRARHARASPLGSARLLRRTGGGHDILSRSQRIPARRRCPRPGRDEGTSSRGGCRHAAWPPHTAITSGPQTD